MVARLPEAAARREVRRQIAEILKRLGEVDRRVVLEDLLDELYTVPAPSSLAMSNVALVRTADAGPAGAHGRYVFADQIVEWAKRHPTQDGTFSVHEAAAELLPGDDRAFSKIYAAIVRSSPQSDRTPLPRKPRFEWLGNARFRLHSGGAE